MSERVRNVYNMFVGTTEFDAANAADYAYLPDAEMRFAIVREVIGELREYLAEQTSGARAQASELKSVLIQAVKRKMREFSAAARALNFDDAGFRRLFRVPDDNGVGKVVAAGREFVEELTKHKNEFKRFGITDADIAALAADLDQLENARAAALGANAEKVGATAGIDEAIERGMKAEIFLDALIKIVYRNDAAKLGAWKSARHVRRSDRSAPVPPS